MFASSIFVPMKMLLVLLSVSIVFWNVENFYDYHNAGTGQSDEEFSSTGAKHWTKKRFLAKCSAIAGTLFWIEDRIGDMPDIVAFEEVENRRVLSGLLNETALKKLDYHIIHYDSEDHRGIDVALIYRCSSLRPVMSFPVRLSGLQTRDILFVGFVTGEGDSLLVSVNHHPSKYGGESSNDPRLAVARRMVAVHDSLYSVGWHNQLAGGDFNDGPESTSSREIRESLTCPALPLYLRKEGTIRFDGRWELIDLAFVTRELELKTSMEILRPPFLTTRDAAHSGTKPLRTYSGPRYLGGVSDHYPILLRIDF